MSHTTFCTSPFSILIALFHPTQLSVPCALILGQTVPASSASAPAYTQLFGLTCLLELPLYTMGLKMLLFCHKIHYNTPATHFYAQCVGLTIFVNLISHPFFIFAFADICHLLGTSYHTYLALGEALVIILEALLIRGLTTQASLFCFSSVPWVSCFTLSLFTNILSWWIGAQFAPYGSPG